ncbi:MAG TPA: hypothetical protein ENJ33_00325 [Thiothrix sp.]|nr:hypothetical protein [Thiothrix sp.]
MRITVYPNTENFVMSDRNKQPLSAAVNDVLHLSDAERIKITQIFLRQIPLCCLTQRAAKIVTAIFSQTIDFNKYEDDMNGRRLQQLTNLFPHHANEVVRYLESIHVLISREGHYGKYLSINFNFSQWGKEECDGIITNDPTIMLDKERFIAKHSPEYLEKIEKARRNPANQAIEPAPSLPAQNTPPAHTPPDYLQDLLKNILTAIGRIGNMNDLSEKQGNTEKGFEDLLKKATDQQQAAFEKAFVQQQEEYEKAIDQQQAAFEKAFVQQQAEYEKAINQQQAGLEKTIERLLKKALATTKQTEQNTEETANENDVPSPVVPAEPASEPVIETVIESETDKQPIEKSSPHQEMTAPLPSSQVAVNTDALIFPSQLSQDQRHDAKKLLQRADHDKQQILLDMLSKRLRNTHNPVNSPIAYLTNLLMRLENNCLDMPLPAMPATIGTGSIAPAEPRPLRESERRRTEYQEAVADCIQMKNNIKLMGRNDSLTFNEALDKFDMRGLWDSICERFTETKEALAAIQPLNARSI